MTAKSAWTGGGRTGSARRPSCGVEGLCCGVRAFPSYCRALSITAPPVTSAAPLAWDDPRSSVVNPWGQSHDHPNLIISDASVFVTSAAVNPALTIAALSLRSAQALARKDTV